MVDFEYYNPVRVVFGPGEIKKIGKETRACGKAALLVTYLQHDYMSALLDRIKGFLEAEEVKVIPFFKISENPTSRQVDEGVELSRKEGVDVVIGIGGGSVMDAAKVIAAGVLFDRPSWDMIVTRRDQASGVAPMKALPIILVPTLPATSSEMNCGAIILNEETHEKCSVFTPVLYAKTSITDPELTLTLPAHQTNCGGVDAISHVMEVYLSGVDDTPFQDKLMEGIIITIMDCLARLNKDLNDISARSNMMWAATVAWNGWTRAGTGATTPMHLIAHPMTANYGIAHGVTLAIVMPAWMRHTYKTRPERYAQFAQHIFGWDTKGMDMLETAAKVIDKFEEWIRSFGIRTRLSEFGIGEEAVDLLEKEIVRTGFGPDGKLASRVPATREDLREVLKLAL